MVAGVVFPVATEVQMKKHFIAAGLVLSALLLFSCATTKTVAEKQAAPANIEEELPFVSKTCTDNEIINTYQSGKIKNNYDELPPSFEDAVVFECESEYYYNNQTNTSVYELIYIGVKTFDGIEGSLENNTPFATSTAEELKLICRSKLLDKYLISTSNVIPKKFNGYYYYMPGMLLNTTMKYLDFASIEEYSYDWLYHHTVDEDPDSDTICTRICTVGKLDIFTSDPDFAFLGYNPSVSCVFIIARLNKVSLQLRFSIVEISLV